MKIITDKLTNWWELIVSMLPNFLLAIGVLALFILGARFVRKGLKKLLDKTYKNKELSNVLVKIVNVAVIVTGMMVALSILELDKTVTSVLAGAGIIGLALSFAFQDLAANLISGFVMAAKNPFEIGDVIQVKDYIGEVKEIQLRSTLIQTFDGNEVRIPNRILFENPLINFYETKSRMVQLAVGVSYAEDLEKVEKVTKEAIENLPVSLEERDVQVIYKVFGGSSINLEVRYWVDYEDYYHYLKGISEGVKSIKSAYDNNGITIPFPIRTLDFGIKGGKTLTKSLNEQSNNQESN